jgi:four helix bundle protein
MEFHSDSDRLESGEFRGVVAWQRAMDLSMTIYQATEAWPLVDPLDLRLDVRRNAVIVPSKIARGFGMGEPDALRECLQLFADTARQIAAQIGLAVRIGYSSKEVAAVLWTEIEETICEIETLQRSIV